ncbi:MAG TPA: hypothetical protein PKB06_03480 [Actinotalea sp.]|nr:hypothetical protein [Actinotalea sp.]
MRPTVHVFQLYRTAGDEAVWWRYISPNGRSIASCPEPLASVTAAREAIDRLLGELPGAEVVVRPTPQHRWKWTLVTDERVVARGSGDHDRRLRCEEAARKFAETAAEATVDATVHVFRRRDTYPVANAVRS